MIGARCAAGLLALALAALALAPGCSLDNREGPDVTCPQLACGKKNACKDGIIAACPDGVTVEWIVCPSQSKELCQAEWQIEGAYRCDEFGLGCEGCDPEAAGCGI